jgi:hypothetical protein
VVLIFVPPISLSSDRDPLCGILRSRDIFGNDPPIARRMTDAPSARVGKTADLPALSTSFVQVIQTPNCHLTHAQRITRTLFRNAAVVLARGAVAP